MKNSVSFSFLLVLVLNDLLKSERWVMWFRFKPEKKKSSSALFTFISLPDYLLVMRPLPTVTATDVIYKMNMGSRSYHV